MMGNFYLLNPREMWAAVCISKNACTSLKQKVCLDLGACLSRKDEIHDYIGYSESSPLLHPVHQSAPQGYRTFAVWRDPVERFISVYKHFAIEKHAGRIPCATLDIDAWIDWAECELAKPILEQDEHARRQVDYYCSQDVEAIVALGDLNEWFYQQGYGHLRAMNQSRGDAVLLSDDQCARIRVLYEADYKLAEQCVFLKERRLVVSGFWADEFLSPIAELCIRSYLDHGHRFRLYTSQKISNLPEGTEACDACDLLPQQSLSADASHDQSLSMESLRARFLAHHGGYWTEMDMVCLGKLPACEVPWYVAQAPGLVGTGLIGFDPGHPLFVHLAQLFDDPTAVMPWDGEEMQLRKELWRTLIPDGRGRQRQSGGECAGSLELLLGMRHFGLMDGAKEVSTAYPIPSDRWRENFDGLLQLDDPVFAKSHVVKLWADHFEWDTDVMLQCAPNSVVGQLIQRHYMREMNASLLTNRSSRIMVGICSCHKYPEKRQAVRETWLALPHENIECRFFVGEGEGLPDEPDTVVLPASDEYDFLPEKVRAFFIHCLETSDFEWLFKCDDDTYLALDRLHSLIIPGFDLIGDVLLAQRGAPSGGAGYMLSRQLVEAIVGDFTSPTGAEDLIFGEAALRLGAKGYSTDRLCWNTRYYPRGDNEVVSSHWCSPRRMHAIHTMLNEPPSRIYQVSHQHWNDHLFLYERGFFARASTFCSGEWREDGDGSLNLDWFDWGAENVVPDEDGYRGASMKLVPMKA